MEHFFPFGPCDEEFVGRVKRSYDVASNLFNYPSPWPLPKFLYAYSSYTYTKDWKSVVVSFYVLKVIYVLLFYVDEGNHPEWFDGLGNYDHVQTGGPKEPSLISVVVGDFIFLFMGITLGKIQSFSIENGWFYAFSRGPSFMTMEDWANVFEKLRKREIEIEKGAENASNVTIRNAEISRERPAFSFPSRNLRSVVAPPSPYPPNRSSNEDSFSISSFAHEKGIWPPSLVFPCMNDDFVNGGYEYPYASVAAPSQTPLSKDDFERAKWAHRRFYWFYLVQSLLLGTPATMVYNSQGGKDESVRYGTLVYLAFQLSFLSAFYFWNRRYHFAKGAFIDEDRNITASSFGNPSLSLGTMFDASYGCWIGTVLLCSLAVAFKTASNVSVVVATSWAFFIILWAIALFSKFVWREFLQNAYVRYAA